MMVAGCLLRVAGNEKLKVKNEKYKPSCWLPVAKQPQTLN